MKKDECLLFVIGNAKMFTIIIKKNGNEGGRVAEEEEEKEYMQVL